MIYTTLFLHRRRSALLIIGILVIVLVLFIKVYYIDSFSDHYTGHAKSGFGKIDVVDWTYNYSEKMFMVLIENNENFNITVVSVTLDKVPIAWSPITIRWGSRDEKYRELRIPIQLRKKIRNGIYYDFNVAILYTRQTEESNIVTSSGRLFYITPLDKLKHEWGL